ncbi:MAG TPA: helix-turn-helix transcriptional regulator [Pseudolabrys sp.]|nr:helix-turn-helix transcriptional regulator [Pseudolabrys sp.]
MAEDIRMAEIAALVGDPARANILSALMGGRALTAKELAGVAGVSPQTTSGHLGKLFGANLVARVKQGRHRYFRIATPQVAEMLEAIMAVVAATPPRYRPPSKADDAMRMARTCYDHVAGMLGVQLADRLVQRELIILGAEAGEVTSSGTKFLTRIGVDLSAARARRRVFCRPCVDWTERRPHIGGAVGAALASWLLELKWIERVHASRAVMITPAGRRGLQEIFAISL